MEENQNGLPAEPSAQDMPCKDSVGEETVQAEPTVTDAEPVRENSPETDTESVEEMPSEERPCFDFGVGGPSNEKREKRGRGAFFAIFGSVIAICLALLILLLFLGDNGIRIFRTLHSERVVYVREDDGTSGLLTPQEVADRIRKSTVTVSVKTTGTPGIGSGFVYDANGHICTNYHVIEGALSVQVTLPDGNTVDAEVVGYDIPADLAVLRVQASGLLPVTLGSSSSLLVGDEVVAVGTPASMTLSGTATFGKVSYTNRLLPVDDNLDGIFEKKLHVIQTDTSVNFGNSGGPMADMYGRVIGVVVRKIAGDNEKAYEGLGFAIPIDGARIILDAIIEDGSFTGKNPVIEGRSLLGVTGHAGVKGKWYLVDPLTNKVKSSDIAVEGYHYMPANGVYVTETQGANAKNRLYAGDVILAVNGFVVQDMQELLTIVNCYPCGTTVSVRVLRGDAETTVQLVLDEE